jgi:hypothetical protein
MSRCTSSPICCGSRVVFLQATVSGSNLCPSKDDIEFDIICSFLNIHQQQGVFWLLDSQEFLHRKDLRCGSKHDLFAMFSLEGVKQKRRRFLCLLVRSVLCLHRFCSDRLCTHMVTSVGQQNLSRACNLKWSRL